MKNVKYRKVGKRMVAALLCFVMLVVTAGSASEPVLAAEPVFEVEPVLASEPVFEAESVYAAHPMLAAKSTEKTTFVTNNQKEDATILSLRDGMLCVDSFPSGGDYTYIQIGFETGGKEVGENFELSNPARPLPKEDGTYYVSVNLCGSSGASYSRSLVPSRRLQFTIKNGKASFVDSPVYDTNQKLYSKRSTSDVILGYYKQRSQCVESDAKEIKEQAKKIVNAGDSDYEKIRKVHDWVADNIYYDLDEFYTSLAQNTITSMDVQDAVTVLKTKRAVCGGYANLTAALLRSLGIPTRSVTGYALGAGTAGKWTEAELSKNYSNHAWNEAYADGRWIILDTTWDSNNTYYKGELSEKKPSDREYFDPTLEAFSLDHRMMKSDDETQKWLQESIFAYAFSVSSTFMVLTKKGETRQLKVKRTEGYEYIKMKNVKITYSSSDKKVATVNRKGKITAKKRGKAIITTKIKFDSFTFKYQTEVNVWGNVG